MVKKVKPSKKYVIARVDITKSARYWSGGREGGFTYLEHAQGYSTLDAACADLPHANDRLAYDAIGKVDTARVEEHRGPQINSALVRNQSAKTTELRVIRETPSLYTWGVVHRIHEVGRYVIVEYTPVIEHTCAIDDSDTSPNFLKCRYAPYVNEKSMSSHAETLEGAILLAIGYSKFGPNEGRALANAACKLLDIG